MAAGVAALFFGQTVARQGDAMAELSIEIKDTDSDILAQIADAEFRTPQQQASAFVHAVLAQHRARASAPDKPMTGRRGPRTIAA